MNKIKKIVLSTIAIVLVATSAATPAMAFTAPHVTPSPHVTVTPHITETPHVTTTPHITEAPHITESPHITETPHAGNSPHVTETPHAGTSAHNYVKIDSPHPFYVPKDSSFAKSEVSANFYKGTSDSSLRDAINRSSHTDYSTSQISALWIAYHSGRVPTANKQIQKYESEDKQKQSETDKAVIIFLIIVAAIVVLFMILF